ncbi:MAG: hypothetical protein A2312_01430 [Candidatus Staskawiczbacteria bacterium RIFOXYB2_FULL_32_9]|uniref:Uncharacterized protein n=1 Tax=Candidatus Staskawiczbacteria bacterium RIFOXYD1_FULL_32_13 TaxID=1802234 RepID=A0A1G2JNJ8_9BACT|nr:MAG: hypothetical protein UR22_C0023G0004 [Parcubacteria group bacterium GW2011_GWC2_32_10]OGZ77120.1 MAG: hypothetical protein A2256_01040 [Candidatus Staskawiczbacteria bacterium RIFOXYA2_FULL_32_7]OGZ79700.1 MAG: hypothetical protein A2360_02120 [Candidatus Staskawiczbacteria bacterium RIFOXYB1_FULL_32_11]OGZ84346.1 MAG: hypothetical protein A2312_01430 [Candidatus Staskawiczbacteria bacterium RIFOXYB2_FULL_32_9]OGZ85527.1 MAG: hypothetical protein A2463_02555 [Candidatus Staskawiczbacter
MNFVHWLVILSVVISVSGSFAYIKDTLKGKSKPNRVSWFLWALAPFVATGAAIYSGADLWATVRIFTSGFLPLIVFIASFFNKQSYWKLNIFDLICGFFSVLALIVWAVTNSPITAILLVVIGDGFASLPTILKAWKYPETETGITFVMSLVATIIILPSIPIWNIQNSAFQVYLLLVNVVIIFSIYRKRIFKNKVN